MSDLPRILIVDDSRVVRVSLTRHLQGHFDIREEGDGEAAWQTLVLDHSIRAVISDLRMPKLNGYELLERLRLSKLRRLQQMPFILVSGEETEEERARACALGVSDFVTKGAGSAEILARLNHLLALSSAQEGLEAGRQRLVQDPESGLYSRKYLELQAAQAMAHAARHGGAVSAQGEIGGEKQSQRRQPPQQLAALPQIRPHRGSGRPVKLMTQWDCTMTLPFSSVTSAEQKASLPPTLSTFPTAVRVLPAAAAAR